MVVYQNRARHSVHDGWDCNRNLALARWFANGKPSLSQQFWGYLRFQVLLMLGGWFALASLAGTAVAEENSDSPLVVRELPPLPEPLGVAAPFVGLIEDRLLVAGGANFPNGMPWDGGTKQWHTTAYLADNPGVAWREVGRLPRPLAYGVSVSLPSGLLCIGGSDADQHYADVFLCRLHDGQLGTENWQPLPIPLANMAGARVGDWILVMGGSSEPGEQAASNRVFGLSISTQDATPLATRPWIELPEFPAEARLLPNCAVLGDEWYVFGGAAIEEVAGQKRRRYLNDAWRLKVRSADITASAWQRVSDLPQPLVASPGPSPTLGSNHFLALGGDDGSLANFEPRSQHPGFASRPWLYHRVTDTWSPIGELPVVRVTTGAIPWRGGWVIPTGEIRPGVRTPEVHFVSWEESPPNFGWINYAVLVAYLLLILVVGIWAAGMAQSTDEFFRAGQSIPWWAASLSIFATMLSSITFMSIPAQGYSVGWNLFLGTVYVLLTPLIVRYYLPFFRQLDVTSAYEYLERRFNVAVRLLASSQFILFQLGRIAVVLLLPALALSTVAGIDIVFSILVVGVLCLAYTLFGGMTAVIWTDAAQAVVLMVGATWAVCYLLLEIPGGVTTVVNTVQQHGRFFQNVPWSWDLTMASGWFIMIGSLFTNLFSYTASQDVVQRYITTKDEPAAARAIWGNVILSPLAQAIFFAIGSCLLAYYVQFPARLSVALENDSVFPQFIVRQMPAGVAGLIIAAIFAASQSTISSSLNSLATAYTVDFQRRFSPQMSEESELRVARWATLAAGVLGIALAIFLAKSGVPKSLWETFLTVVGLFSGAISGLFVLGIFSRSANGRGAMVGGLFSVALVLMVYLTNATTFWLFSVIGVTSCVGIGWLASKFFSQENVDKKLTIYGLRR
ncbi:MAG: sodium/solute symporter [Planctomycetaceae bacterium]|nr:sodium/solute symporter [Planctomycetaceae bacterium]